EQPRHFSDQASGVKGYFEVVVCAGPQSRHDRLGIFLVRTEQQNRYGLEFIISAKMATKVEAVHLRHRNVADDEIGTLAFSYREAFEAVVGGEHRVACLAEQPSH